MKNTGLKILLHDLSLNKKTLVLKDYLGIYFEHVFLVHDPGKFESNLADFQHGIIIVMPDILMIHGERIIPRIRGLNPMVPILMVSKKDGGAKVFDNRVILYALKGSMESVLQDIKSIILQSCEREFLGWPRVKVMPGLKHVIAGMIIGYSSWIDDVRKKINKFHGEEGPFVVYGPPGTEKLNVVKDIHGHEGKHARDPLVIMFDNEGARLSTLLLSGRPSVDEKTNPGQINLLEILSFRPVVLMDIEKACQYVQYILSCILKDTILEGAGNNLCRLYILVSDKNQLQSDLNDILQAFEQSLQIPALNQRQEDIPFLVNYYLKKFNQEHNKQVEISETAINKLIDYSWPGNLQEFEGKLKALIENFTREIIMPGDIEF